MKEYTVDLVVPVYKPDEKFDKLMQMLQRQTYPIGKILLMNTEEEYFPKRGYEELPHVEVRHLRKEEFDHGGTRHSAASLLDGDLILFLTQDAIPQDEYLVERLAVAFEDKQVAAAYARQCDRCLVPYENERGMKQTAGALAGICPGESISVFIGPEGGFEESEIQTALSAGIEPLTLGKRILRTETAGFTVLSWLMYHLEN